MGTLGKGLKATVTRLDQFLSYQKKEHAQLGGQSPIAVITTMAHQGDTKIEVSDPDSFPVGKYIVLKESLIYMVTGKGSLILDP